MLKATLKNISYDKIFILTDTNFASLYDVKINTLKEDLIGETFVIPAGEENKNLQTLSSILSFLSENGATRNSILICIGGGITTDIGGFAAAIFKRGIRTINIATTILGAVDAAVGGKTGIDFCGLKNEIGAFHLPLATLFDATTFSTLPPAEILSGFGEIAKTALLAGRDKTEALLEVNPLEASFSQLSDLCSFCRDYKMMIVEEDPTEKGKRKVLNLGHTAGHAMESLLIDKGAGVPHGVAVAHGNLISLILSNLLLNLDSSVISAYCSWLKENYPRLPLTCKDYDALWEKAIHDKKNKYPDQLAFTLLHPSECNVRDWYPVFDIQIEKEKFFESLDIYQEIMGQ